MIPVGTMKMIKIICAVVHGRNNPGEKVGFKPVLTNSIVPPPVLNKEKCLYWAVVPTK